MSEGVGLWGAFVAHALREPDATALVWRDEELSYGALHGMVRDASRRLAGLALEADEPVGLRITKSPQAIALVLACMMHGRRFLLPSPTLPEATLALLFESAGCRHVLGVDEASSAAARSAEEGGDAFVASRPAEPADVCFMLTTSGSTGQPKIVPLHVGAVERFVAWASERFGIEPGTAVLSYAPLNFDLCLLDIWTTLARGGRVVLVDSDQSIHAGTVLDLIARHRVSVVQAVPMFFRLLIDGARSSGRALPEVAHVIFTGDAIPIATLTELPRLFPTARLYNIYGCTETNDSFIHEVDPRALPATKVPLGGPLPGVEALILAGKTELEGSGVGELYVWTPFQTTGYLDAKRNEGKFVPHPLGRDDRTFFRTGDLVRRDAEGLLFLEGRNDFQIKIRGVAINTLEVEQVLLAHQEVMEAVVVALPDAVAGKALHCVVRRTPDSRLNSLVLKKHCAERLPKQAIPTILQIIDDPLPKTSTGKVDRSLVEEEARYEAEDGQRD